MRVQSQDRMQGIRLPRPPSNPTSCQHAPGAPKGENLNISVLNGRWRTEKDLGSRLGPFLCRSPHLNAKASVLWALKAA